MPQVHKSVQCTFAVLQGEPRVLEAVLREQVVLHLQGSGYKQKEITRKSSCTKVSWPIIYIRQQISRKQAAKLTSIETLSTTAQSVSIILKKEAHQTYVRAWKGAITRRTQWWKHKNAAPSYMQISLNWTLLRMPPSWHSPFNNILYLDSFFYLDYVFHLDNNPTISPWSCVTLICMMTFSVIKQ